MSKRTSRPSGAESFAPNTRARLRALAAAAQQKSAANSNAKPDDSAHYGATSATPKTATMTAGAAVAPKIGEAAPDFKLPYATQEGIFMKPEQQMALSSQRGHNVILAFYPRRTGRAAARPRSARCATPSPSWRN